MTARTSSAKGPLGKHDVQPKLVEAWSRVISRMGRGTFSDKLGVHTDTVGNALKGPGLPELHTALNSLLADITALDEVFALYGVRLVPTRSEVANDLQTISEMSDVESAWLQRLLDGQRCHRDTAALAKMFRPLVAKMQGVIAEAEAA